MDKKKQQYNLVQRVIFILGIVVLIALFSLLIFEMTQQSKKPPVLEISINHHPHEPNNSYQLWVQNRGEETAENTALLLNLYQEGEIAETGTVSIDYVPPGSKAEAWIVFQTKPKPSDSLVVSSITYIIP